MIRTSRTLSLCFAATLLAAAPLFAAQVTASVDTDSATGQVTVTIVVTPDSTDMGQIKDFHLLFDRGRRLPPGTNGNQPAPTAPDENGQPAPVDGWGNGVVHASKGKQVVSWHASTGGSGLTKPTTFRIQIPNPTTNDYHAPEWRTTKSGSTDPWKGTIEKGKRLKTAEGEPAPIPVELAQITGPDVVTPGTLAMLTVEAGVGDSVVMPYTVRATLSLDPNDPTLVNAADPVPPEWGLRMTTNSPEGTTSPSPSVVQATYHGDMRNVLVLDFPDDPAWIGRTIYLQAEFGDGTSTLVHTIEVAASLPQDDP